MVVLISLYVLSCGAAAFDPFVTSRRQSHICNERRAVPSVLAASTLMCCALPIKFGDLRGSGDVCSNTGGAGTNLAGRSQCIHALAS